MGTNEADRDKWELVLQGSLHPVRWFVLHPKNWKDFRQGSEKIRLAAEWKMVWNVTKLEVFRRLLQ